MSSGGNTRRYLLMDGNSLAHGLIRQGQRQRSLSIIVRDPISAVRPIFMEVEVDTETGEIDIKQVVCVNDVGKAINPEAVEGQQYGGAYMAVSRARTEEVIWDPIQA